MKINTALLALAISAFGIGSTEFVIMGILPQVSHSFNVTIPQAGYLVSVYALGVAIGAPILAFLTRGINQKTALLILMGIFITGNVACALSTNYFLMIIARIITSFAHGTFFGIGAIVATHVVAPERKASAIALMFTGLTLANVIGVPFGTWIAHHWDWHLSFWLISAIGVVAFIAISAFIPGCGQCKPVNFMQELRVVKDKQVLMALGLTILTFTSVLALLTYIAPIILTVIKLPLHWVSIILLIIGIGTTCGNIWGGRLANRSVKKSLSLTTLLLLLTVGLFYFATDWQTAAVIMLFFWGVAAFATVPALQLNVVHAAHAAPNMASTLNIGAFNIGNALGAYLGGLVFVAGFSARGTIFVSAVLALTALMMSFAIRENKLTQPETVTMDA